MLPSSILTMTDFLISLLQENLQKKMDGEFSFIIMTVKENFTDVSQLLPDEPKSGSQIAIFDYNDDGDLDIVIAGLNGGVFSPEE